MASVVRVPSIVHWELLMDQFHGKVCVYRLSVMWPYQCLKLQQKQQ